jgi:hypothetical protein
MSWSGQFTTAFRWCSKGGYQAAAGKAGTELHGQRACDDRRTWLRAGAGADRGGGSAFL